MQKRRFIQCDVFSPLPTRGNGLAVVIDANGLDDVSMQRFAAWTNLAETTFVLPPDDAAADYRLKIFTPLREMPFAGHPTLGSCAAWLYCGGTPRTSGKVFQQCGVGLVEIDVSNPQGLAFVAPPTEIRPLQPALLNSITQMLAIDQTRILATAELDNGPIFQVLQLDSAASVLALDAARVRWPAFKSLGFVGAHPPANECDYEVRHLAPSSGMSEDPITGSLNSALAHWLQSRDCLQQPLVIAQGTNIDRLGRISIRPLERGQVAIGGQTHILIDGQVEL